VASVRPHHRPVALLAGTNTPDEVELQHISRPPPSCQPMLVAIDRAVGWPDTTGRLRQSTLAAGPALRWQAGTVSVVVSGGVAWVRLSGEAMAQGSTSLSPRGVAILAGIKIR
jgi:hypothetical protein